MKTSVVTASTYNVLSLTDIRSHLNDPSTDHNTYLTALRSVAVDLVEKNTNRKLAKQIHKVYFDSFPNNNYFEIPYTPLITVPATGLRYTNSTGQTQTLSSTKWDVDSVSEPGRLVLDYNDDWPTDTLAVSNPISIEFQCGYNGSSSAPALPASIKHALLITIANYFEHREDVIIGAVAGDLPRTAKQLLAPYRIFKF